MNSIFISLVVTIGQLVTCSLAAYTFARLEFPGRGRIFLLLLGTRTGPSCRGEGGRRGRSRDR